MIKRLLSRNKRTNSPIVHDFFHTLSESDQQNMMKQYAFVTQHGYVDVKPHGKAEVVMDVDADRSFSTDDTSISLEMGNLDIKGHFRSIDKENSYRLVVDEARLKEYV